MPVWTWVLVWLWVRPRQSSAQLCVRASVAVFAPPSTAGGVLLKAVSSRSLAPLKAAATARRLSPRQLERRGRRRRRRCRRRRHRRAGHAPRCEDAAACDGGGAYGGGGGGGGACGYGATGCVCTHRTRCRHRCFCRAQRGPTGVCRWRPSKLPRGGVRGRHLGWASCQGCAGFAGPAIPAETAEGAASTRLVVINQAV